MRAFLAASCSWVLFGANVWTTLCATFIVALVLFAFFGAALAVPALRGRKIKRRCACATSRDVVKLVEERERAAFDAKRYRPETVDLNNLPQTSREIYERARRSYKGTE